MDGIESLEVEAKDAELSKWRRFNFSGLTLNDYVILTFLPRRYT
jgi:hypothetical protein